MEIRKKLGPKSIFLGDFNVRHELWDNEWHDQYESSGDTLIDFVNQTDYVILNDGRGTRIDVNRGNLTAIDITLVSAALCVSCEWLVGDSAMGSNHYPIVTSLNVRHKHVSQVPPQRWKLSSADWDLFRRKAADMDICFHDTDINRANDLFISDLMVACEVAIPKTRPMQKNKKSLPWWNEECTEAVKKKRKLSYKYRKYKTPLLFELYRQAREDSKFTLKRVKQTAWEDFISLLNYKTHSKLVWNTIRKFNRKPFHPIEVLKQNGIRYHENKDKAEILAQHYKHVSSDQNLDPAFRAHKEQQDLVIEQEVKERADAGQHQPYNAEFSYRGLITALSKKKSTAPGADTVHYDMLRNLPDTAKFQLLKLINKSWNEGSLPSQWKESTIVPILKPGKDPHEPASYRPISLTSAICKITETMVATRLTAYLESNQILAKEQSGFRKNRSTIDQLTRLETAIRTAKINRHALVAVFLDLEKAFDLLWTKGVLNRLVRFGIDGKMLIWIKDFLAVRKMNVRVGSDISGFQECENGSPQGSVLSPILFLLVMNTLEETLRRFGLDLSLFADDGLFWKADKDPIRIIPIIQIVLDTILDRSLDWGFKISTDKTSVVVFNKGFTQVERLPKLKYNGKDIQYAKCVKFLGMYFDHKLTWKAHIDDLIKRCNSDLNLMRMVSGTSFGADKLTLLRIYFALIRSKLDYGCQAYASAARSHLSKLDSIQAHALRIATGAYKGTRNADLNVECNVLPLSKRRDELILKYWARSSCHGDNLPINDLTQPRPEYQRANRFKRDFTSYAIRVQDLVKAHKLQDIKFAEITFPEVHKIKSITPRFGLSGEISKKTTSHT